MKKVPVSVFLMLSLHVISMHAAQELPQDSEQIRQIMIDDAVKNLPDLNEDFNFLKTKGIVDTNFHDFLEQNVSHDKDAHEETNFDQVIINAQNIIAYYALHSAACKGDQTAIETLLAAGVDVNIKNKKEMTPLYFAVIYDKTWIIDMLINAGADVNIQDKFGSTPLHRAVLDNNQGMVKKLLAVNNAHINTQDKRGKTPLHHVRMRCPKKSLEIVDMLIAVGADLNIQDKRGNTPLHEALWNYNNKMAKSLINASAQLNILNKDNQTSYDIALGHGCCYYYEIALRHGYYNIDKPVAIILEEKGAQEGITVIENSEKKQRAEIAAQAMAKFENKMEL